MTEASHEEKLPGDESARRLLQALLAEEFTKFRKELSKEFDLREIRLRNEFSVLRNEFSVLKKQMAKLRETQIDQERSHHSELLAAAYTAEGALLPRMRHMTYPAGRFKYRERDKKQASIFST